MPLVETIKQTFQNCRIDNQLCTLQIKDSHVKIVFEDKSIKPVFHVLNHIKRYASGENFVVIDFGEFEEKLYQIKTEEVKEIIERFNTVIKQFAERKKEWAEMRIFEGERIIGNERVSCSIRLESESLIFEMKNGETTIVNMKDIKTYQWDDNGFTFITPRGQQVENVIETCDGYKLYLAVGAFINEIVAKNINKGN